MGKVSSFIKKHPNAWEFILFNLLSNCATAVNFVVMWICTGFVFSRFSEMPFRFLVFNYADNIESNLGLCGFLSFLTATACAQIVNLFVQKNLVFQSNAAFEQAVPKYILLACILVLLSAALPAYSQSFFISLGAGKGLAPTLATLTNIVVQVLISYPAMKFWVMPDENKHFMPEKRIL